MLLNPLILGSVSMMIIAPHRLHHKNTRESSRFRQEYNLRSSEPNVKSDGKLSLRIAERRSHDDLFLMVSLKNGTAKPISVTPLIPERLSFDFQRKDGSVYHIPSGSRRFVKNTTERDTLLLFPLNTLSAEFKVPNWYSRESPVTVSVRVRIFELVGGKWIDLESSYMKLDR
jgi:hypothetical protein